MNALLEYINEKLSFFSINSKLNIQKLRNKGEAVFDYDFMMSLDEKDYPKYLCQAYYIKTEQKLNLKHPKTINEKIQWLKIYDNLPIKTTLTDKVLVRDWIKEKIGEEYLKPALWIGDKFDDIPFNELPETFVIKCNHGCKWYFIIKDKKEFCENSHLFQMVKITIDNWMIQSFFGWSDFETQYKNIEPKILIEPLLRENKNNSAEEIEVWCFNGHPKIIQKIKKENKSNRIVCSYDEELKNINLLFQQSDKNEVIEADNTLYKTAELSKCLAKDYKLVRVDWMLYKDKLYFGEMTFTPFSGFITLDKEYQQYQLILGNMLTLKG